MLKSSKPAAKIAAKSTTKTAARTVRVTIAAIVHAALAISMVACSRTTHLTYTSKKPTVLKVKKQFVSGPTSASLHLDDLKAKHQGLTTGLNSGLSASSAVEIVDSSGNPAPASGSAMSGEVTFAKKEILDRQFLFGADLQYSSVSDSGGMYAQSTASGHVIAKFQILGDRLQVVSDESANFESNINHPSKLIQQFPILRQDADTVTVTVRDASFAAVDMASATDSPVRNTWVRSIEYVPQGNYLLVETSVQFNNGKVVEFMESLFPRDSLVKAGTKPLFNEPEREPKAGRYRFLDDGDVWIDFGDDREKTAVAERFDLSSNRVLEWYVTPNIPAEYLPVIKLAVEGWNRYSQKMWHRDMMKFVGIVPAGVKLGDPRYNIINWDSVPDAGSAYESQGADPLTGITSHSMIYLPYAWIKIGKAFWTGGSLDHSLSPNVTTTAALKTMQFMGQRAQNQL